MHISRIAEELIIWNSDQFKFISLKDNIVTGSSIMPQKKNPDTLEFLRGKTGSIFGNLFSMLTIVKGLPIPRPGIPESFKVLVRELQALCLDVATYKLDVNETSGINAYEINLMGEEQQLYEKQLLPNENTSSFDSFGLGAQSLEKNTRPNTNSSSEI